METLYITQYVALFKPLHIIGTHAQAHCLLILLHNYKLTAGVSGSVIKPVSSQDLIQNYEGDPSRCQKAGEMKKFYSDILVSVVFQK
jgi:hypothetical protein